MRALVVLLAAVPRLAQEPAPRRLTASLVPLKSPVATISGVRELRDGRLLISDGQQAGLWMVDASSGAMTRVGTVGGDELQYAQPGGFYSSAGDTALLLDRGLTKFLVIAPNGNIVRSRSIQRRGVTESSSEDIDRQRLDARGLSYFIARRSLPGVRTAGSVGVDSTALVRFDAVKQLGDTVALLRGGEVHVVQANEHVQLTRGTVGSPRDDWGVAPDGRIAVVRGTPYRVDWYAPDGRVTRGPTYTIARVPFTPEEKDSIAAASKSGVGASVSGGSLLPSDVPTFFADAKAAFGLNAVTVAPTGQVWVARSQPRGQDGTLYDVFDNRGERIDRVMLDSHARVVGFGSSSVYAMIRGAGGKVTLARYKR
jgi:hypothetical protein